MNVICFGDSNTWGHDPRGYFGGRYDVPWPQELANITGWNVHNEGRNGREIPREMPPHGCDLLIVMLGTNDLLQGCTSEEVCARMDAFLKTVTAPVLLLSPPPMARGAWVSTPELVEESRRLALGFHALASRRNIRYCDTGQWHIPLCFDGVHFTEEGHKIFARNLSSEIRQLTGEATDAILKEKWEESK